VDVFKCLPLEVFDRIVDVLNVQLSSVIDKMLTYGKVGARLSDLAPRWRYHETGISGGESRVVSPLHRIVRGVNQTDI